MKKFIIISILFNLNIIAQETEIAGSILYSFKANNIESKEDSDEFFDELNKQSSDIKFNLLFEGTKSMFKIEEEMESDYSNMGKSYSETIVSKGSYYSDLTQDLTIRKVEFYGETFLISSKPSNNKWKLQADQKKIGKYNCFKATTNKVISNQKGDFNFEIVAWYTPELPISHGPKGYNNLPGLILELKDAHFTFYVSKISLSENRDLEIYPFKGKAISEKEFYEKTIGVMKSFKK